MELTTTDCSSRKTLSGRTVSAGEDKSSAQTPELQETGHRRALSMQRERRVASVRAFRSTHLGCEGRTTPRRISPGSERVLAGASGAEAVQEPAGVGP